jgi:hypothetical protein
LSGKKRLSWQFAGAKRDTPRVMRAILLRAGIAIWGDYRANYTPGRAQTGKFGK